MWGNKFYIKYSELEGKAGRTEWKKFIRLTEGYREIDSVVTDSDLRNTNQIKRRFFFKG